MLARMKFCGVSCRQDPATLLLSKRLHDGQPPSRCRTQQLASRLRHIHGDAPGLNNQQKMRRAKFSSSSRGQARDTSVLSDLEPGEWERTQP